MKPILYIVLLAGLASTFAACHTTQSDPPVLDRQQYTLGSPNPCDTTTNTGVDVSVSYIQLKDDTEGARKINDSLRLLAVNSVVNWLDSATIASHPDVHSNLEKAASLFAKDYEVMRKDMGSLGGCWELETSADTVHVSPRALTVRVETRAYTGGAHPNSNLSFYTFDRETGRTLTLNDMIADTTALLGVLESAFRQQQHLLPQTSLEEQGYFLRDGHFFLPANIGTSREGLVFYYNPYEIAAYAVGPIQVTVPYEKLNGILRDDWQ
ncbi:MULTISPECIES: DUF3298 and DUF4163 domain-containing protein [unclassified Spirosoma]|uniref:DUF3298 and DUF4163 domain-containing protein n=1 Tax=unclassified Spirosoma TaxID=2621999 RepID=UPI00095B373C|nr:MULTISPECIES: DUF3298 and DUF4163 domain-containing protein [unclassified Spirosoma]MBN8820921.1 DUF3298 domain-containing protein [Spirosoma sp.]OJW75933.1 MAG: hypothetical protein BGO59_03625 [Spirosoma sp. 48-14]